MHLHNVTVTSHFRSVNYLQANIICVWESVCLYSVNCEWNEFMFFHMHRDDCATVHRSKILAPWASHTIREHCSLINRSRNEWHTCAFHVLLVFLFFFFPLFLYHTFAKMWIIKGDRFPFAMRAIFNYTRQLISLVYSDSLVNQCFISTQLTTNHSGECGPTAIERHSLRGVCFVMDSTLSSFSSV